jgi:hypothetical protein
LRRHGVEVPAFDGPSGPLSLGRHGGGWDTFRDVEEGLVALEHGHFVSIAPLRRYLRQE